MVFNRICLWIGCIWMAVSLPAGLIYRPTMPDFGQYYVGALIARNGEWKSLYPIPVLGSRDNAGLNLHSFAKPGWRMLCLKHSVPDYTHFILPPTSALALTPLSFLSYKQAYWLWIALSIGSVGMVAWIAGLGARTLFGGPTRVEGALALLITLSPMTARAVRIANVSPFIALAIGVMLLSLLSEREKLRCAAALLAGLILKYATLVLLPLYIATRRWKTLFIFWIMSMGLVLLTVWVAGTEVFFEFQQNILPTLSRPSWYHGNQSFPGMLARLFGRPLHSRLELLLSLLRVTTLGILLTQIFFLKKNSWRSPPVIFAAMALLLSWLFVFSPIAWEHWPIFLCPLWGWIIWESHQGEVRRAVAYASLALMYFPAGILQVRGFFVIPVTLPEPYNSTQLVGILLTYALASWRLSETERLGEPAPVQEVREMR